MKTRFVTAALGLLTGIHIGAANWPQWRGPLFNGSTDEKDLPADFARTNAIWSTPLPGYSGATPAVWNDSVFVVSPNPDKALLLFCIDAADGKIRWQQQVATGDRDKGRNNMASPSPATDGQRVFALFATGDLAAFDFAGKPVWKRNLGAEYGKFAYLWIYGASPALHRGRLYISVLQRSPVPSDYSFSQDGNPIRDSYLLCLDPATGTNHWRHVRKTDAVNESMESYTTPALCETKRGPEILVLGGNYLTAHHADTGAELWRCAGFNPRDDSWFRIVPSPVVADGMVIACAPKREPVYGIPGGGNGPVQAAWKFSEFPSDCVTPLYYRDRLYVLDGDRQRMTCLDPKTGEKQGQVALGVREIIRASPTGADGKIYCITEGGTAIVLAATEEMNILATIPLGEAPVRSSVVAARGRLFIRTSKNLFCFGGK